MNHYLYLAVWGVLLGEGGQGMLTRCKAGFFFLGIALIAMTGVTSATAEDTLWHVKGVHPKGYLLDIKAVDPDGNRYDVMAIEEEGNAQLLAVKAFVDGRPYPVKVIVSDERNAPVRAIDVKGKNFDLKALTPEGKLLDIMAVRRSGSILHIKVLGMGGRYFGVKAISPDGLMYNVKGIKMTNNRVETMIGNVKVHAHVKAIPPGRFP